MKAKRLPSINEQLDSQISLLEEMVNSFSSKWKIFIEDKTYNSIDKSKELNNNIFKNFDINLKSKKNNEGKKLEKKTIQSIEDCSRQILMGVENNYNLQSKYENNIIIKNNEKSKDKNGRNNRKKSKSKKLLYEESINNKIKEYFSQNTAEHKIFTKLQNNIYLFCSNSKTSIIIADSFSEDSKDNKKYFNNILKKIKETKCPIIILTNNYDNILNKTKKNLDNLIINFILKPKNNSNMLLINLYTFIMYINLKLFSFKLNNNITTYEDLLKKLMN